MSNYQQLAISSPGDNRLIKSSGLVLAPTLLLFTGCEKTLQLINELYHCMTRMHLHSAQHSSQLKLLNCELFHCCFQDT